LSFAKIRLRSETIAVSAATINLERTMDRLLLLILGVVGSVCRSRADLVLENAALRHQLGVLMRAGRRPRVTAADRWFWVVLVASGPGGPRSWSS
jgi:hypothetical protein